MACLRKWRGALACALWASVAACFLATGTTRHPPRSVKLRGLPPRVDAGDANVFWAAVQKAAARNGTDVQTYMKSLVALARGYMSSSNVVDRDAAIESMMESMQEPGKLTLVLGGKNLGKSFLKKTALQRSSDKVVALSVDMRSRPGTNLLDSILVSANQSWEEVADEEGISGILGSLSGMVSAAVVVQQNMGQAANPFATMANNLVKTVVETVTKKSFVRSAVDAFLARVKTKPTAIVVDEANLALPGLTNGEKARSEAKEALAAITQWTKQDNLASVVLISSEFAYPFSLQAAGLDLRDIGKVMVIGEVPKHDMLQMLKNDWGMDDGLAQLFYDYFGGDIFTTKQALDQLIQKKETFNPYAVVDCPGLPSCVKDSKARAHLENIAQQGFSFLADVETDAGARLIAQKNVGGVIRNGAVTFGLPDIFNSTDYEWAVIPSSYHMRWRVARALQNIPLPTPGPPLSLNL